MPTSRHCKQHTPNKPKRSPKLAQDSRLQLLQTVVRAQQAEALLFDTTTQHTEEKRQRQERIPHVTTRYLPAPDAAAQPIPQCVFTAGWLRDYNTALGVSTPTTGATATGTATTAWAAPGTEAELLASGITPADILAHAQDYGLWARHTLAQLNALLDLQQD